MKKDILLLVCMMSLLLIVHQNKKMNVRRGMFKDFGFIFSTQDYKTKAIA